MLYPDFLELLQLFASHRVQYALIGGYAVAVHAEPRFTKDLDLLVVPSKTNAKRVIAALREFGAPVESLAIEDLSTPGLIYVFGVAPLRVDIINRIKKVNVEQLVKDAVTVSLADIKVKVVSLEDLIKLKKLAGRPQDKADIAKLKEWRKRG
jgi:predicted nucleotidyltransferase